MHNRRMRLPASSTRSPCVSTLRRQREGEVNAITKAQAAVIWSSDTLLVSALRLRIKRTSIVHIFAEFLQVSFDLDCSPIMAAFL
jgi:hypothetical protein